jgi:hypothetical protein
MIRYTKKICYVGLCKLVTILNFFVSKLDVAKRSIGINLLESKNLYYNNQLKNKYAEKRCFVVGNGSSLNKMDLKKLKDEYVFVVNNFILHKDFRLINPAFYVNIEPVSLLNSYSKNNYYHPHKFYPKIDKTFKNLDTLMFFEFSSKQFIEEKGFFKEQKVFFLRSNEESLEAQEEKELQDDFTKPHSFGDGVIWTSVALASYMGFNPIYIIGCDVDSFSNKSVRRFYPPVVPNEEDRDHDNEYYAYGNYSSLKRWRIVVSHLRKRGIKIYNAGIGGENDTCERVDFNKLFHKKRKN